MCAILVAAILGPRAVDVIYWLLAPDRWNAAFNSSIVAILGILFLPWTTLAYVVVAQNGLTGLGLIVVIIGFFADIGTYGSSAYTNKDKLGYK